jgi:hypothetical protein
METIRIQNGQTEKIVAYFVDDSGAGITGETIPISIWRESDGYWFTGAAWQAGYTTFNMSEQVQGYYYYDFNTASLSDDVYHIKALCADADCINPSQAGCLKVGGYVDDIQDIKDKTDNLPADPASEAAVIAEIDANETKIDAINTVVDSIATKVSRLMGLSHENIYIDNPVYDVSGNLASARVRIYSNKDSVGTTSDVMETYTITAVGNGVGKFTTWKQVGTL